MNKKFIEPEIEIIRVTSEAIANGMVEPEYGISGALPVPPEMQNY